MSEIEIKNYVRRGIQHVEYVFVNLDRVMFLNTTDAIIVVFFVATVFCVLIKHGAQNVGCLKRSERVQVSV